MFRATHIFGPMQGTDVSVAAPRTPQRVWYAPCPVTDHAPFPNGYMQVGWDLAPDHPWPGQVEYVLDRDRSDLRPHALYGDEGMEEGVAVYMLAGDS